MAVTNAGVSYAQAFTIAGADADLTGILQYRKNGDLKLFFSESARVDRVNLTACVQAGHPTEYNIANRQLLQEYANGDRQYYVEWVTYDASAHKYTYHTCFDITNSGGQTLGHYEQATYSWYEASPYDDAVWGKPIVWFATETYYPDDPITGSYPDVIYPYGGVFVAKTSGPVALEGEVSRSTVYSNWMHSVPNYGLNNDTDYTKFLNGEGIGSGGDITPKKPEDDPSGPGGGGGAYRPDVDGDPVPVPGLPTVGAVSTGMVNLYNPTPEQIRNLASFLWSGSFLDNIGKLKNDPFENIISLSMVPYQPANQGSEICVVGNISTDVTMRLCSQYQKVSCGSLKISEQWGGFLDYSPYTHIDLYLPFIGIVKLKTDDVMGKTLSIEYNIDVLSGSSVCHVSADGKVLYTFNCNTTYHIPLTLSNANQQMSALASIGSHTIMGALTGAGVGSMAGGIGAVPGAVIGGITGGLSAVASGITAKEHSVQRSGSITGEGGLLGDFKPYVIIHRPVQSLPNNFKHFKGYASNIEGTLGSFSGYTEVAYVHLDGVTATDTEKDEIEKLLKSGVIV